MQCTKCTIHVSHFHYYTLLRSLVAKEAETVFEKHGSEHILSKKLQIESAWSQLKGKSSERRRRLDENYKLQKFLSDYRDIISWIELMKTAINSEDLAKDVACAEILLERHQEHKGEIDAREDSFQSTEAEGKDLIEQKIGSQEVGPWVVDITFSN